MNRRQFLGRALLTGTALAGGASLLSGCGSQGGTSSTQASAAGGTSSGSKGGPIRIGFIPPHRLCQRRDGARTGAL
jgi:hypothetical protein